MKPFTNPQVSTAGILSLKVYQNKDDSNHESTDEVTFIRSFSKSFNFLFEITQNFSKKGSLKSHATHSNVMNKENRTIK